MSFSRHIVKLDSWPAEASFLIDDETGTLYSDYASLQKLTPELPRNGAKNYLLRNVTGSVVPKQDLVAHATSRNWISQSTKYMVTEAGIDAFLKEFLQSNLEAVKDAILNDMTSVPPRKGVKRKTPEPKINLFRGCQLELWENRRFVKDVGFMEKRDGKYIVFDANAGKELAVDGTSLAIKRPRMILPGDKFEVGTFLAGGGAVLKTHNNNTCDVAMPGNDGYPRFTHGVPIFALKLLNTERLE